MYDASANALLLAAAEELENNHDALATAIIGALGNLDLALSPERKGSKGFNRWLLRQMPKETLQYCDEILNIKASDFKHFAMRLINMKKPSVAVVSSKAAFEGDAEAGKVIDLKQIVSLCEGFCLLLFTTCT